jgi:hypothetical protein
MCGVYGTDCPCTAHISNSNSDSPESEFTQVMNASELASPVAAPDYYYSTPYPAANASTDKEEEVIVIPEQFRHAFYSNGELEFTGMPPPKQANNSEQGLLTTECGATSTLTDSFHNMTSVVPKVVTIQLAMEGATMKTSHMGYKTYYVYDRTGTIRLITCHDESICGQRTEARSPRRKGAYKRTMSSNS